MQTGQQLEVSALYPVHPTAKNAISPIQQTPELYFPKTIFSQQPPISSSKHIGLPSRSAEKQMLLWQH
jgi:hypothetical protein